MYGEWPLEKDSLYPSLPDFMLLEMTDTFGKEISWIVNIPYNKEYRVDFRILEN
jgi:hypothetical protein